MSGHDNLLSAVVGPHDAAVNVAEVVEVGRTAGVVDGVGEVQGEDSAGDRQRTSHARRISTSACSGAVSPASSPQVVLDLPDRGRRWCCPASTTPAPGSRPGSRPCPPLPVGAGGVPLKQPHRGTLGCGLRRRRDSLVDLAGVMRYSSGTPFHQNKMKSRAKTTTASAAASAAGHVIQRVRHHGCSVFTRMLYRRSSR